MSKTDVKKPNMSQNEIKPKVDNKSTEIKIVRPELMIFSQRRKQFDMQGNRIPSGKRWIIFQTPNNRQITFDVSDIFDLYKMREEGNISGCFNFEYVNDGIYLICVKNGNERKILLTEEVLDWSILVLKVFEELIKKMDK